jgi:hypothetical protein
MYLVWVLQPARPVHGPPIPSHWFERLIMPDVIQPLPKGVGEINSINEATISSIDSGYVTTDSIVLAATELVFGWVSVTWKILKKKKGRWEREEYIWSICQHRTSSNRHLFD